MYVFLAIIIAVLVAALIGIVLLAMRQSEKAVAAITVLTDTVRDQAKLISSRDPMTYQALRAFDMPASYDETSSLTAEETTDGDEDEQQSARRSTGEYFSGDDPLIAGGRYAGEVN